MFPKFCMLVNCYKQNPNREELVMCNDMTLVVCFLLSNYPTSGFYMPTFRNTLFHLLRQVDVSRMKLILVSFYSHLPAYEDGTDRVFRNVGI